METDVEDAFMLLGIPIQWVVKGGQMGNGLITTYKSNGEVRMVPCEQTTGRHNSAQVCLGGI